MVRFVAGLNAALTVLVVAAALAAAGGLAGGRSPALDVLSHLAPIYAAVGLVGLAWAVVAGRGPAVAAAILAVIASGALMAPELRRRPEPVTPPVAGQIKVIQFNAYKRNGDIRQVADWLIGQEPDIVVLEEARHDLRDLLLRRTGWAVAGRHGNVMIFSRRQRLGMTRPRTPRRTPIAYVNATYPNTSGPFEVVATHFDWPTHASFRDQHAALARVTAQLPRDRMILAGDFNTTPWSAALSRTDRALGLRRLDRAMWSYPAWAGPLAFLPIDHVYVGPGWRLVSLERGPNLGSDHYPLIVKLAPSAPRQATPRAAPSP